MLTSAGSPLNILTAFVVLIIVGLLVTEFSRRLRVSNILLLIIAGIIMGYFFSDYPLFNISGDAVLTIAILTLVLVVFDGASRFKAKSVDTLSFSALKLSGVFLAFNVVFISFATVILFFEFSLANLFYSLIFATVISGTDPASVFIMLSNKTHRVLEFLKIEGVLNTPIIVLLPFLLLDIKDQFVNQSVFSIEVHLGAILTQILVGIGSGIIVGLIFFKGMKKYNGNTAGLMLICSALLSFILAENLGGNGVLAVAVLGFMFGSFYISKKEVLQSFSEMLSNSLEVLVFILVGFIIELNFDFMFIAKSLLLFLILILCRFAAVNIALYKKKYTAMELLYITLNMPKGLAVAVLIFAFATLDIFQMQIINNLILAILIYSLVLSTIVNKFSEKFINMSL